MTFVTPTRKIRTPLSSHADRYIEEDIALNREESDRLTEEIDKLRLKGENVIKSLNSAKKDLAKKKRSAVIECQNLRNDLDSQYKEGEKKLQTELMVVQETRQIKKKNALNDIKYKVSEIQANHKQSVIDLHASLDSMKVDMESFKSIFKNRVMGSWNDDFREIQNVNLKFKDILTTIQKANDFQYLPHKPQCSISESMYYEISNQSQELTSKVENSSQIHTKKYVLCD